MAKKMPPCRGVLHPVDVGESSRVVWPAVLASGCVSSLKSRLIVIKVVEEFHEYFFFLFLSFFEWFNLEKHMVLVKWTLPRWGFSYSYTTCSSWVGCCNWLWSRKGWTSGSRTSCAKGKVEGGWRWVVWWQIWKNGGSFAKGRVKGGWRWVVWWLIWKNGDSFWNKYS